MLRQIADIASGIAREFSLYLGKEWSGMCGIAAIIGDTLERSTRLRRMLNGMEHRGDQQHFGEIADLDAASLGANRLAIVGRGAGCQPAVARGSGLHVVLNGEVYNHQSLIRLITDQATHLTHASDTQVVAELLAKLGPAVIGKLEGMFAIVAYDATDGSVFAARDRHGIKPLYYLRSQSGWYFASELKAFETATGVPIEFPPGTYFHNGEFHRYHSPPTRRGPSIDTAIATIRELFEQAVRKMVQTDLPIGVAFSGGIDSSLVLHFARKHHPDVCALTVGLPGCPDLEVARRYCAERGIEHDTTEIEKADVFARLPWILEKSELFETIDVIDCALSSFVFESARKRRLKIVLTGDGSDEALAGYQLFEGYAEKDELMAYRVGNMHRTDLKRVDMASMLSRIEARVPFLDENLSDYLYSLPMEYKRRDGQEKWILRQAFLDVIPDYLLQRKKLPLASGAGFTRADLQQFAEMHPVSGWDDCLERLEVSLPEDKFCLRQYLNAGLPAPVERYKRRGLDY